MVIPGMRQGLIVVNDPGESEAVVQFFTGMIINRDPSTIADWRAEYVSVNNKEFQEELKLLAMPLIHEHSVMRAVMLPDGRELPVIMRRIYILLLAPPVGLIIFSQPSIALLVSDGDRIYLGYRGIDPGTGGKVVVTIKSSVKGHVTVPFMPAIARYIFIGDVVEAIIDDDGQARGLRH
ncbi:MAG: hypothetical protein L7G96_05455 [Vulcanisaeta sp.]|nr:hypothetical protein [Vulcanisaeta sp.]